MDDADWVRELRRLAKGADREKAHSSGRYKLQHGSAAGIRIADELRRQALAQHPDWPGPEERAEDRAAHERSLDVFAKIARRAG